MNLFQFQEEVFGSTPNEVQAKLYARVKDGICGYFEDGVLNEDKFLAILVLAFWQTLPFGPGNHHTVVIIIPPAYKQQVLDIIKSTTKLLLERFVESPRMYGLVCKSVKSFQLGSRILDLSDPPERWVCYGFNQTAPLPSWMQGKILV